MGREESMSTASSDKLTKKISEYIQAMELFQTNIQLVIRKLNSKQAEIEKSVLEIYSNRRLSTKERTEQMIPLMESQDTMKEFLEDIEALTFEEETSR